MNISVNTAIEKKKQGDLFGIFFEDLNHAADGGLYGELVQNRSFEFDSVDNPEYHALTAWKTVERGNSVVGAHVETRKPLNEDNLHYLVLEVLTEGEGGGILNEGYLPGIPVEKDKKYLFSCYYRLRSQCGAALEIRLESENGEICYAKESFVPGKAAEENNSIWEKYECELAASGSDDRARLVLLTEGMMTIELDMISLFPKDTFKARKNGLRKDLAEMFEEMKPKFIRFPGGCLMHIGSLDAEDRCGMYRWKKTVGPVESRPARRNSWNYNQTLGLGFYEFFQFCEDIGAEPLPVISAGYDPHALRAARIEEMQEWIDEAMDLIEFANGSVDTKWGAVRASMGHPESFHMKYLGIGNEEVGEAFFERYEIILNAVKEKHPEIQVIGSGGPGSAGSEFVKGWSQAKRTRTSLVDEHFYQCPEWFIANEDRYAAYDAEPKAFLGEYASKDDTWKNALYEAAFMTGMEKAEGVGLACYAPLLCNVNYTNWKPDMVYYDNHRAYGAPSYYVQKLFMVNQGEALLETEDDIAAAVKKAPELTGKISFTTQCADVEISQLQVENEKGILYSEESFGLNQEENYREIGSADSTDYTISFRFCRRNGSKSGSLRGEQSFELEFAKQDEQNRLVCRFDGWEQLLMMAGFYKGYECDLGNYLFEIENGREYEVKLQIQGPEATVWIDGEKFASHVCRSIEPKDLYYSAVKEEDGSVIVKLVRVKPESERVRICLSGDEKGDEASYSVKITKMEGFALEDRNSFEQPEYVSPQEQEEKGIAMPYTCEIQGNSLTILKFRRD